jgi:hypothetical protein
VDLQLESMESFGINGFTIGISGINWNQKESSERHNITRKEKPSTEAISSEGHC